MKILIADSGSTKTEWCLIDSENLNSVPFRFYTDGLNPYYHTMESIRDVMRYAVKPNLGKHHADKLFFYGAGCSLDEKKRTVANGMAEVFNGIEIDVKDDLLGAARALCGHESGIACILGTGSNSCLFDGEQVMDNIPSLGFILGDEGSGGHIGKLLIHSFFYRDMPEELRLEMQKSFTMDRRLILDGIYHKPQSNRFVASFAQFTSQHKSHPFIKSLVKETFDSFLKASVFKYENYKETPIGFIGSVAFTHKEIMMELFDYYDLKLSKFIKTPMETLIDYHRDIPVES